MFALVLGTVVAIAANPETLTINERLRNEIGRLLDHPNFSVNETTISAKVEFLVNQKGEIVVLMVDTQNEMIRDFIRRRLNYHRVIEISENLKNKKFSIPVTIVKN